MPLQVPAYKGLPEVKTTAGTKEVSPFMNIDVSADAFGSAIGKGLSLLGQGLESVAELQLQDRKERQNFDTANYAVKLDEWVTTTMDQRARQAQGTPAYGYTAGIIKDYEAEAKKAGAGITDPKLKRDWELRFARGRAEIFKKAYDKEWEIRDATTKSQLKTTQDILLKKIEDNPDQFEQIVEQGNVAFDAVPGTSPEIKAEMKRLWRERAQIVLANKGINSGDADAVSRATGGDTEYFKLLRTHESSGNDRAQSTHPRTGKRIAFGRYQWTDDTWRRVINTPEGRAAGLTVNGRGNGEQEEKAIRIFTKMNASDLTKAGINPTDKNLYMAHFMGSGGAIKFINAMKRNPTAAAADMFPEAAAANPTIFYARGSTSGERDAPLPRTLEQVYAIQTRRFGGSAYNSRYDNLESLPFAQRQQIRAAAEQQGIVDQNNRAALIQAQETLFTNQMALAATQGGVTKVNLDQAFQNGQITDYANYKKINDAIEKFQGSMAAINRGQEIVSGRRQGNPFDKDDREGLDAVFNQAPKETRWQTGADMTQKYRIAPPTFAKELQAAIMGSNPQTKAQALGIAGRLLDQNGNAFAGVPHAQESIIEPAIKFWNAMGRGEGVTQAMAAVNDFMSPDFKSGGAVRNDAAKKFRADLSATDPNFTKMLDASYWFQDIARAATTNPPPGAPITPQYRPRVFGPAANSLYADYLDLAERGFQNYGNSDEARSYAELMLKGLYGVIGNTVMRLPPKTYPTLNGTHDWVPRQAAADANDHFRRTLGIEAGITDQDVQLVPIRSQTKEALDNPEKGPPMYHIWYKRMIEGPAGPYPIFGYLMGPNNEPLEWYGRLTDQPPIPLSILHDEARALADKRREMLEQAPVGPMGLGSPMSEEEFQKMRARTEEPDFSNRSPTPRLTRTPPGSMQKYPPAPWGPMPEIVDQRPERQRPGGQNLQIPQTPPTLAPPPTEHRPRSSRNVPRVPDPPPRNRRGPH